VEGANELVEKIHEAQQSTEPTDVQALQDEPLHKHRAPLPMPSMSSLQEIAERLSEVGALRSQYASSMVKTDGYMQAFFDVVRSTHHDRWAMHAADRALEHACNGRLPSGPLRRAARSGGDTGARLRG
jgi:hypothetical protein